MRSHRFLILAAAVLVGPLSAAWAQFPGGFPGGGRGDRGDRGDRGPGGDRGSMRGMSGGDPSQFFDMIAKGKNVITRDDVNPMMQRMVDSIMQRAGITNGRITREQFTDYMQKRQAERAAGGGFGGPGGPMTMTVTSKDGAPTPGGAPTLDDINRRAEERFRQMDKDGDGLLSPGEMSESLLAERDKWDANKDGFIDLYEYKAYNQARAQQMQQERGPDGQSSANWSGGLPGGLPFTPPEEP